MFGSHMKTWTEGGFPLVLSIGVMAFIVCNVLSLGTEIDAEVCKAKGSVISNF